MDALRAPLLLAVFGGCAWAGILAAVRLRRRAALLAAVAAATACLARMLEEERRTLKEALEVLPLRCPGPLPETMARRLLEAWGDPEPLPEAWAARTERLIREEAAFSLLRPREAAWLANLPEEQAYPHAGEEPWPIRWAQCAREARQTSDRQGPLLAKLGILLGIVLAVILL